MEQPLLVILVVFFLFINSVHSLSKSKDSDYSKDTKSEDLSEDISEPKVVHVENKKDKPIEISSSQELSKNPTKISKHSSHMPDKSSESEEIKTKSKIGSTNEKSDKENSDKTEQKDKKEEKRVSHSSKDDKGKKRTSWFRREKKKESVEPSLKKKLVIDVKNEDDFATKLKDAGNNLVVIDFFAQWCGPCKMIAPKIEELAKEYPDVVFLKVDVDECEDIATEYEISAMPTFVFVRNGNKVETFSGANYERLKETLLQHK